MNEDKTSPPRSVGIPPPQRPSQTVHRIAVDALRGQSDVQLEWLGAVRFGSQWRLPVMDRLFLVDPHTGEVCLDKNEQVRPTWQILTLHYLATRIRPDPQPLEVTFASLPSARSYARVYQARVNRRLCATVGNDAGRLRRAAAAIHARCVDGRDATFDVNIFPRVPIRLLWYAGDDELTPSCTLLLPANIESFFSIEDIVVLSESFVARLADQPF